MQVKTFPIKSLKLAKFNPKSRSLSISGLAASIERVGLIEPISITPDMEVVNGHRRIAACIKLGWTEIPATIAKGNQAELFAEANGNFRSFTGNQVLEIFLSEPAALGPQTRARIAELEEVAGRATVERMQKGGYSLGTWMVVKRLSKDADQDTVTFLKAALRWMLKYKNAHIVRRALQAGTPPSKIIAAINHDKPLRVSFASA